MIHSESIYSIKPKAGIAYYTKKGFTIERQPFEFYFTGTLAFECIFRLRIYRIASR